MTSPDTDTPVQARILLAEPNGLAAAVVARVLGDAGYGVSHVTDARAAQASLLNGDVDLLITAWELPGTTGGALCAALREDPRHQGLQIIVLTAHADSHHQVLALEAGADDHVTKPVAPAVLVARVRAALRSVRLERERNDAVEDLRRREAAYREIATEQAALHRVAARVARAGTPEEVFGAVAVEVARVLGCEAGVVVRCAGDTLTIVGRHVSDGAVMQSVGSQVQLDGPSLIARLVRGGTAARIDREPGESGVWRAAVGGPVRVAGRLWGGVAALSLTEGVPPDGSEARVERFADMVSIAIANAQARQEIADMALRDTLTGLPNRRWFDLEFARLLESRVRAPGPLSLVIMDIDRFKHINDTHGHAVGDAVLQEVARRLAGVARTTEPIARVGGEEFAWLISGVPASEARWIAERARLAIEASAFPEAGVVTISAGVADIESAGGPGALYRSADAALYEAKRSGRNRCVVAVPAARAA